MKRKLIRQGADGLTITVPKEWTTQHHLTSRDEVDLCVRDDALVIRAKPKQHECATALHLPVMDIHAYRHFLYNAYRRGFTEINITFDKPEQFPDIRAVIDQLLGFEITHQSRTSVTLKSVALPDEKEYPALFRRSFHIVQTAFSTFVADLHAKKFPPATIASLRLDILRIGNYCERILHHNPAINKQAFADYTLLTLNDAVLSQFQQIYATLHTVKKPSTDLVRYADQLKRFFEQVTTAIFAESRQHVLPLITQKYILYATKREYITSASKTEREACQELGCLLRLLTEYVCVVSLLSFKD